MVSVVRSAVLAMNVLESRMCLRMALFSEAELEFLRSQRIGRFATVGPTGWSHVVPVMYAVDDSGSLEFDVDGVKLRNLTAEPRSAMVVDAMGPQRGVSIHRFSHVSSPSHPRRNPPPKYTHALGFPQP